MYTQKIHEHWARPDCTKEFEENDGSVFLLNGKCPLFKKTCLQRFVGPFFGNDKSGHVENHISTV